MIGTWPGVLRGVVGPLGSTHRGLDLMSNIHTAAYQSPRSSGIQGRTESKASLPDVPRTSRSTLKRQSGIMDTVL